MSSRVWPLILLSVLSLTGLTGCEWLPEVESVRLSESSVTLKVGGSKLLVANVDPANAEYEQFSWNSSDPSIVSVSNGRIVAMNVGTAQITASAAGVTSSPCQVTVDATRVTGISLSSYSVEITEGESTTLNATVSPYDATDPSFSWRSDNTSVATVQNGKIVAISSGTANISVKTTDGNKTATCKVTVKSKVIDVTGITLSKSSISVKEGETMQLRATVQPSNATIQEVSWQSGDNWIATVASDGTATGVIEGTTTITAISADAKVTATCKVTVTADYVDFPDPNFRKYMVENFDLNKNGKISLAEAAKVTKIKVNTVNIESLLGIEKCHYLAHLECTGHYSNNQAYGRLQSLNLSENPSLVYLSCTSNQLSSLDLSKNTALETLRCDYNQLMSLDVSVNTTLDYLSCDSNLLTSLDVSKNTALTRLSCFSNQLSSLDLSKNTALETLWCDSNQLTTLDVTRNTSLKELICRSNQLTSLDLSKNTALETLWCDSNRLKSLDVSKNRALTGLSCDSNRIASLDVSRNTALTFLSCDSNQLSSLDVSRNTALTDLYCDSNQLTSLDVSKNTGLIKLWCRSNHLKSLDISKNTLLVVLICYPMENNSLKYLYMATGQSVSGTFSIPITTQIVRK